MNTQIVDDIMYEEARQYRVKLHREVHNAMKIGVFDQQFKTNLYKALMSIPTQLPYNIAEKIRTEIFEAVNEQLSGSLK